MYFIWPCVCASSDPRLRAVEYIARITDAPNVWIQQDDALLRDHRCARARLAIVTRTAVERRLRSRASCASVARASVAARADALSEGAVGRDFGAGI